MSEIVIDVSDVSISLGGHPVHRGLGLSVTRGEVVALIGGSGSGKSVLLREIIGLMKPQGGHIKLFGQSVWDSRPEQMSLLRRRFGVLFQHGALFSAFNVFDNIAFPLRELRCFSERDIADLVHLKLSLVELLPRHGQLMPAELSGGMVKRVALARALALEPELLLLDEPTAGLDPDRSAGFVKLTRTLGEELGLTVVLVTHDLDTLSALATRVAVLADQKIVAYSPLDQLMNSSHPFIHSFFFSERGTTTAAIAL